MANDKMEQNPKIIARESKEKKENGIYIAVDICRGQAPGLQ